MLKLTVVVWFLLSILEFSVANEVLGCGGFVKSSKSNIDLSRIQIALFEKRSANLRYHLNLPFRFSFRKIVFII